MNVVILSSVLLVLIAREEASCGLVDGLLQGLSSGVSRETTTRAPTFNLINPFLSLNNERLSNIENTSTTQRVTTTIGRVRGVDNRLDEKSCPVMMPLKKKRFYRQFLPVRPENEVVHEEEVVYYLDAAPDFLCSS